MKTVLCLLFLVSSLSDIAATQAIQKDVTANDDTLKDNDNNANISTEEGVFSSQKGDTDTEEDFDEAEIADTETIDIDYDVKDILDLIEQEIYKRLADIEKAFEEEEENEQVTDEDEVQVSDSENSKTESSSSNMTDSENNHFNIEDSESQKAYGKTIYNVTPNDGTEKNEIKSKIKVTDTKNSKIENQNSDINGTDKETVIKSSDGSDIEKAGGINTENSTNSSETKNNSESKNITENSTKNIEKSKSNVEKSNEENLHHAHSETGNSIIGLEKNQSEAGDGDFDIDNYYDELLNSNTETFYDFIGDDEDAYSVVDITLPSDTQFEMVKYEKEQNGRKVLLMKLVPIGTAVTAEKVHLENCELVSDNGEPERKELLLPVKDTKTVDKKTSLKDVDKGTKTTNENLLSSNANSDSESKSSENSGKNTKEKPKEKKTFSDFKVVQDDNVAEDVYDTEKNNDLNKFDEKSMTDEAKNYSKSVAAEDDGTKWCICYSKLSDIPWVVRMQMGV